MTDIDRIRALVGDLPSGGVPAAWWISTDTEVLRKFDEWADKEFHHNQNVSALAEELGCKRWFTSGRGGNVVGFDPPQFMGHWNIEHPEYVPVPLGWRIDSKSGYLVPSRRTKKDRESDANEKFAAIRQAAQLETPGMPRDLWLPGAVYGVSIRRGADCVMAFCGGDPDRVESRREFEVDENIWERLPLSSFHLLREGSAS